MFACSTAHSRIFRSGLHQRALQFLNLVLHAMTIQLRHIKARLQFRYCPLVLRVLSPCRLQTLFCLLQLCRQLVPQQSVLGFAISGCGFGSFKPDSQLRQRCFLLPYCHCCIREGFTELYDVYLHLIIGRCYFFVFGEHVLQLLNFCLGS